MKKILLDHVLLICPICSTNNIAEEKIHLELHEFETIDEDIKSGAFVCPICRHPFPIIDGIPIFTRSLGHTRYEDEIFARYYIQNHFRSKVVDTLKRERRTWEKYDPTGFLSSSVYQDYYEEVFKCLSNNLSSDSVVLDLGCSVGRLTFQTGSKAKFAIGVDPSFVQIQLARQILQEGKVDIKLGERRTSGIQKDTEPLTIDLSDLICNNVEFIVADDETIPFPRCCFDIVCNSAVIERTANPGNFLINLDRVVKDGGYLLLTSPFDWDERFTPITLWIGKDNQLPSEEGLKKLLMKMHYKLIREHNIPWITLGDFRHYHTWSVYAGLFQSLRPSIKQIHPEEISSLLVECYQDVFKNSSVYQEFFNTQEAKNNLEGLDTCLVALVNNTVPIGFAGGKIITQDTAGPHSKVYHLICQTFGHAIGQKMFYIAELGVKDYFEGKGIGRELLKNLITYQKAEGHYIFFLHTPFENERAIALYKNLSKEDRFELLCDGRFIVSRNVDQLRTSGNIENDQRAYLFLIAKHTRVHLKKGKAATLIFFNPKEIPSFGLEKIAKKISKLFAWAFWHSNEYSKMWQVKSIMNRLPFVSLAILAFSDSTEDPIGYALFDICNYQDKKILFIDSMAAIGRVPEVSEDWQSYGLGSAMLKEGMKQIPTDIVAARTQNPAFILMIEKNLNPKELCPFTTELKYTGENLNLLKTMLNQVTELRGEKVDLNTGISRWAYREGKLGDYLIRSETDQRVKEIEDQMNVLGLKREAGDAIIVLAKGISDIKVSTG